VANLSASDLRFLSTPEAFASLLTSAVDLRASLHGGTLPPVGTVTPGTTFGELLDLLVSHKLHRAYVVDEEGKPTSIITLTDVLKRVVA
jgi:CBS domain-containing protein